MLQYIRIFTQRNIWWCWMYKTNLYQRSIGLLDHWIKQRLAHQILCPSQQFVEAPVEPCSCKIAMEWMEILPKETIWQTNYLRNMKTGMDRRHGCPACAWVGVEHRYITDRKSGQQYENGDIAIFTDWMEGQWCGDGHNGGRVDRGHDDESLDRVEDLPHRQHGDW